jgi:hypothetical protein
LHFDPLPSQGIFVETQSTHSSAIPALFCMKSLKISKYLYSAPFTIQKEIIQSKKGFIHPDLSNTCAQVSYCNESPSMNLETYSDLSHITVEHALWYLCVAQGMWIKIYATVF